MSTNQQRISSAIQRIAVQAPELQSKLDDAESKGAKPGAAGVGGGLASEEGDNIVNETRICCDGTEGDPNPGVDERNPEDGGQPGLDPDDPADIGDQGPGTLDGVTDCATGEPISFDGAGFIPPDGWDAPDDPPVNEEWVEGEFAHANVGTDGYGSGETVYFYDYSSARQYIISQSECPEQVGIPTSKTNYSGTWECQIGSGRYYFLIGWNTCTAEPSIDVCQSENLPPLEELWPSDGYTNLAIKGGKIVGSKYDPENDGSYSAPRDSIDLCDGEGNQISLAPAANGGWKTINSTTNNGYLYDSSGKQIAHIDGNEYSDPTI